MPRPALRSRSLARKKVRLPSGTMTTHYSRRRPKQAHCGACGALLAGIPRVRPSDMARIPKSQKHPTRMYGGALCPACTKETIKSQFFKGSL